MCFRVPKARMYLFLIFFIEPGWCTIADNNDKLAYEKKLNSSIELSQVNSSDAAESSYYVFFDSKDLLEDVTSYEVYNNTAILSSAEISDNVCSDQTDSNQTLHIDSKKPTGNFNSMIINSGSSVPFRDKKISEITNYNQGTSINNENSTGDVNFDAIDGNSSTNTGRKKLTEVVVEVGLHNEPEYDCELLSNAEWVTLKILKDDFLPEFKGKPKFFGPARPRSNTKAAEKIKGVLSNLNCENLKRLDIRNALLADFPEEILRWKTISALDLSLNDISSIPKAISELNQLENLDLIFNNFSEFPENVTSVSSIRELNLINNRISSIPTSIKKMTNLEVLILSCNSIREISDQINNLKKLKSLVIANNKISNPPVFDLNSLCDLRVLTLSSNKELTELFLRIPEKDCKLEIINLKYCSVSSLPANFCFLPNIKQIALDVNYISEYGKGDKVGLTELSMVYDLKVLLPCLRISKISELKSFFEKSSKLNSFNNCNAWDFLKLSKLKFHIKESNLNVFDAIVMFEKLYKCFFSLYFSEPEILELYYNGINYIMYLYNIDLQKNDSFWKYYSYPQYRNTMKNILMDVLVKLDKNKTKDFLCMEIFSSILSVFKKSQSVQLAYLYSLSRSLDEEEGYEKKSAENFTTDTIAVLKDYIFSMTVNIKGYDQSVLDFNKRRFQNNLGILTRSSGSYEIDENLENKSCEMQFCGKLVDNLFNINKMFFGKFTPFYVCEVLSQTFEHMPRSYKAKYWKYLGCSPFVAYYNYSSPCDENIKYSISEQHKRLKSMKLVY